MSAPSRHWIKQIETLVFAAQEIPMWGAFPPFPWEAFSKELSSALGVKDLTVSARNAEWKKKRSILTGMGRSPLQLAIELSPLEGHCSLVFPAEDALKLSAWTIHPEAGREGFSDPYLQKGFFRYLCAQSMEVIETMGVIPGLAPKLIEMPLEKEDSYCIDIAIEHQKKTIWARLICPTPFQKSINHHYAQEWNPSLPSDLYSSVFTDLSISAGQTTLPQSSWQKVLQGDFVILDHCSYYPNSKKGTFQLECEGTPLFQTKIKENSIKILDYAHYFKDNKMESEDYEKPFDEPTDEPELAIETSQPLPMISPKSVPISLTIEIARLKMSLDKLLKLKPGNVIDLGVQLEAEVSLIANGQCVGRGELLQIGEVIGVKITNLGK